MSVFDSLRSTAQQLKDEFAETYRRMTDPEAQAERDVQREREEMLSDLEQDAGL